MKQNQNQIRRIAVAAVAVAAVALTSGCATTHSNERRLEIWKAGENRDLVLVRSIQPITSHYDSECGQGKLSPALVGNVNESGEFLNFLKKEVCPNFSEWKFILGFTKSDFGKGTIRAAGMIPPSLKVEADDIVEVITQIGEDGRLMRSPLVTRVVRKNALKERDPTCYWDGQSGRFDAFATGGVVCPAEGWDWRDQKWAKK